MDIEEEIARVIDKAFDDWQGEESEATFVTGRLTPLLNRVRAEALREVAVVIDGFSGTCLNASSAAEIITATANHFEQNSEGNET